MKFIIRFNESKLIKANNDTIFDIVQKEIINLGNKADLNHIDVSGIISMSNLFKYKINDKHNAYFNGDISNWNVENVRDMNHMFCNSNFNGDISRWNVENVVDMEDMFSYSEFNGDISRWNIKSVKHMTYMFHKSKFDGNLNKWKPYSWNPHSIHNHNNMFNNSPLRNKCPIWFYCIGWKLFKSGEDYSDSLKYGWFREGTIFIGRLETAVNLFDGDLSKMDKIKELSHFNFQD